ncbi:uncharacterized protein LOC142239121 [Haematobia irritans]|uniref:uncharacterized protein LOC142239121 n=1 Tax=Haematobia irritans TaxID=7368 RepID=UPI003F4F8FE7
MWQPICGAIIRCVIRNPFRFSNSFLPKFLRLRFFSDASNLPMGGGLEKLQGSFKEEAYIQLQNYNLIKKIREQGSQLKCESCINDWTEFEKTLDATALSMKALRESCSASKHRNCREEAFFLSEQNECSKISKQKLKLDEMEHNTISKEEM